MQKVLYESANEIILYRESDEEFTLKYAENLRVWGRLEKLVIVKRENRKYRVETWGVRYDAPDTGSRLYDEKTLPARAAQKLIEKLKEVKEPSDIEKILEYYNIRIII